MCSIRQSCFRLWGSILALFAGLQPGGSCAGEGERKDSGPYCGLYCVYAALHSIGKDVPFEAILRPRYLSSREGNGSVEELGASRGQALFPVFSESTGAHRVSTPLVLQRQKSIPKVDFLSQAVRRVRGAY